MILYMTERVKSLFPEYNRKQIVGNILPHNPKLISVNCQPQTAVLRFPSGLYFPPF